jgi:ATP-dependent DNA helicase
LTPCNFSTGVTNLRASDWNPQQDLQAQDRCHRIGQTRPVVVFRFATKGTVEEDLLSSADAKRRLEKLVIRKGNLKTMSRSVGAGQDEQLDKEVLRSLLLKDGKVFKYSGDEEILSDKDIETLCDRYGVPPLPPPSDQCTPTNLDSRTYKLYRSDAAYERAARGAGNADGYKVVETGADGIHEAGTSK